MKPNQLFTRAFLLWVLTIASLQAQTVSTDYATQINATLANIDKSRVPNKLLTDYAMEFAELSAYDGTLSANNVVHRGSYTEIYNTLLMSRLDASVPGLINPVQFRANWETLRQPGKIVLSGLYYKYSRYRSDAVPNYLTVTNDKVYDKFVNGVWQNPYEEKQVFAVAAPVLAYNYLSMQVQLPSSLWYTNQGSAVQSIAIDFSDGAGYQTVALDQLKTVSYSQSGTYEWKYRITLTTSQVLYSHTKIQVSGVAPVIIRRRTIADACTNGTGIDQVDFAGTRSYSGSANTAILQIDYANNDCVIRKPLIVAEGFDSGLLGVENPLGESDYQSFYNEATNNTGNLPGQLSSYDIIYVNWVKGKDDLHRNAYLLEDIIKWVNSVKQSTTPNVVMGQSMGAVIARYALRDMEIQAASTGISTWNHKTGLYISHDGPQQGANIPLGILYFARHMVDQFVSTPIGDININPGDGSPITIEDLKTLIDATGTKQLLINNVNSSFAVNNDIATAWQNELHSMGYPLQTKNIAISDGNHCGNTQPFNPSDTLLSISGGAKVSMLTTLILNLLGLNTATYVSLAILFNEPGLLVGILPGNSKFTLDFNAKALPPAGTVAQVYRGKITFIKKLFGIINISVNLTNRSYNSPTGPSYDYYPGGYYPVPFQLSSTSISNAFISAGITAQSVNSFDFIPVTSALDIGKGTVALSNSDFLARYTSANPPVAPKNSPFTNFTTAYTNNSTLNEAHISFDTANGNWLATELDADPNNGQLFTCQYRCDAAISGSANVCSSASYTVPAGADSFTWYVNPSNAGSVTYGQGTTAATITFSPGFSGNATINVALSSGRCGSNTLTKTISVSNSTLIPSIQGIYCPTLSAPCYVTTAPANNYFMFTLDVPASPYTPQTTDYEWAWVSGNCEFQNAANSLYNSHSYIGKTANIYLDGANPTDAPLYFKVRVHNPCGWGDWHTYTWNDGTTTPAGGGGTSNDYFIVSPVPANTYVNINMVNPYAYPNSSFTVAIYSIPPYPGTPPVLPTTTLNTNTGSTSFNTTSLPNGPYLISITGNNISEGHSIMVQH